MDGLAKLAVDGRSFLVPSGLGGRANAGAFGCQPTSASRASGQARARSSIARILSVRDASDHRVTALLALGEEGAGPRLLSRVTQRSWSQLDLKPGLSVYAQIKGVALVRREDPSA